MIFNLVWLPARQTGSSTRTKVLLRIMLRDTTVCEDDLVKQALRLQTTQPDAFTAALDEPGPGMRSDIELALGILVEYQRRGKPLRLIEDFQINEETGENKGLMPERQTSLILEFRSLFDEDEAQSLFVDVRR